MSRSKLVLISAGLILLACGLAAADCVVYCPDAGTPEFRGFWADGYHNGYLNATQTTQMMSDARYARANAIIVEMRKVGDRYYLPGSDPDVPVEPKASNWQAGYTDPLADIIAKAHDTSGGKQRVEVHAWFVVYKVWNQDPALIPSGHILQLHPDWVMSDNAGHTNYNWNDSGYLYFVDPGVPAVQEWTHKVIMDVVNRYDVDGINLDYIRYPGAEWGYNPIALARYNARYPASDTFSDWRRRQVTEFVRRLYADIIAVKPWVKLTIDGVCWNPCYSTFESNAAYYDVFQNWKAWCSSHIIDAAIPMNYKVEPSDAYRCFVSNSIIWAGDRHCYAGQGAYMNEVHDTLAQLCYDRTAGADGMCVYSYYCTVAPSCTHSADLYQHLRDCIWTSVVPTPDMPWKSSPTEGYLKGRVTDRVTGLPIENAIVYVSGTSTPYAYTDGNGYYAHMRYITPGVHDVKCSAPPGSGYPTGWTTVSVNFVAGEVATVDFQLPDKATTSKQFGPGWNLMSVPLAPVNAAPSSVFAGIPINNNLYRYTPGCCYVAYEESNPSLFGNIKLGDGYWLYLSSTSTVSYEGWLSTGTVAIPLATANWYMIGTPQATDQPLANCEVRDTVTSEIKTLAAAAEAGWVSVPLYYYDPAALGYLACGLDPWDNDSYLRAWGGYWLCALRGNLELRVPRP